MMNYLVRKLTENEPASEEGALDFNFLLVNCSPLDFKEFLLERKFSYHAVSRNYARGTFYYAFFQHSFTRHSTVSMPKFHNPNHLEYTHEITINVNADFEFLENALIQDLAITMRLHHGKHWWHVEGPLPNPEIIPGEILEFIDKLLSLGALYDAAFQRKQSTKNIKQNLTSTFKNFARSMPRDWHAS